MVKLELLKEVIEIEAPVVYAYIDPGTGSMLFTILIGLVSVLFYGVKSFFVKIKYSFGVKEKSNNKLPFVVYSDSDRYWSVFKPILEEFEKRNTEINYFTQSKNDPIFNCRFKYVKPEFIGEGNKAFRKLNFLNADILLSTTPSLDVYQWKKSKDTKLYVHIPHACSDITLYRLFGVDYYDAFLLSGQFQVNQIRELEKIRNLPKRECKIVGLTYFDEIKNRLDKLEKTNNDIPVILLAPTWGANSILNIFGEKIVDALMSTGYKIVVRPHPQSWTSEKEMLESLIKKYPELEFNKDPDNFDILNRADLLISEYSGVIFDFALVFDKPIIYTEISFDDSPYDAHWLEEKPWTFKILPKIGAKISNADIDNIKDLIDDCLNDPKYKKGRQEAINEAWENIGGSASAICSYMIDKQKEIQEDMHNDHIR